MKAPERLHDQPFLSRRTLVIVVGVAATLAIAAMSAWQIVRRPGQIVTPIPSAPVRVDGDAVEGNPAARVVIIEYGDFECPYCGDFSRTTLPDLRALFISTGRVAHVFHHYPNERLHRSALAAAVAADCAGAQGRFWPMHDALYANQDALNAEGLARMATSIGLDMTAYAACVAGHGADKIRRDGQAAHDLRIAGTPYFFIGVRQPDGSVRVRDQIDGNAPVAEFTAAINRSERNQ